MFYAVSAIFRPYNAGTHWSEALPMKTQGATEVAYLHVLYKEIFTRYGAPITLVRDRGQNFISKVVQASCKIYQVTRHVASSYHPHSNVACERMNSTLALSLRAYCQENAKFMGSNFTLCVDGASNEYFSSINRFLSMLYVVWQRNASTNRCSALAKRAIG